MKKFILLYKGPATSPEDMSEEKNKTEIAQWQNWMEKIGSSLLDVGQPMANGIDIIDDGTEEKASMLTGYSIIQAHDMEEAKAIIDGHPYLSEGSGRFSIEIHELMPVPGM